MVLTQPIGRGHTKALNGLCFSGDGRMPFLGSKNIAKFRVGEGVAARAYDSEYHGLSRFSSWFAHDKIIERKYYRSTRNNLRRSSMGAVVLGTIQVLIATLLIAIASIGIMWTLGFIDPAAAKMSLYRIGTLLDIFLVAALAMVAVFSVRASKPDN
jgi:hypothetical protein